MESPPEYFKLLENLPTPHCELLHNPGNPGIVNCILSSVNCHQTNPLALIHLNVLVGETSPPHTNIVTHTVAHRTMHFRLLIPPPPPMHTCKHAHIPHSNTLQVDFCLPTLHTFKWAVTA